MTPITKVESGPLDPLLKMLAQKYQKTESQILLRWVMQNNMVFLTTSAKDSRLKDSLDILNFELSPPDFEEITQVGRPKKFRAFLNDWYDQYNDILYDDLA